MAATADTDALWLRRFHPAPEARARLLCLAHAGGSASYFFPVSRSLAPRVEVLAAQYPGRQDRRHEPCLETIAEMADQLADVVEPWTDKPLTLFGHSMGASVAFELALRLQERGTVVNGLFASGRRAPSAFRDERNHQLDDAGLIAEIKRLNGTEAQLLDDDEILRMVLPSIRSDYKAAETYRPSPGPKLRTPVRALIGDSDPKVTADEARMWADHTESDFDLEIFPGGHFYLNAAVPTVTERVSRHIEQSVTILDR
ncbi:thioesterase II family protein [Actinokineospora iranica]|uniref:Surfactin synthase thioesterase subunit n=1 Tax=Actinokineospora iranica TaxID=1271860 RepID=A0A1G6MCI9_9PSEU|nr:alpha/beta fold hydrolase [Actinokineospora iranica]SDC52964.1 Surfactin synthase thioesterase subunit [Actinokineospora iranica]